MRGRSRMTIDPRIPTIPGRSRSGFHKPGGHCLHQAQSAVRYSASLMMGCLHPSKISRLPDGLWPLVSSWGVHMILNSHSLARCCESHSLGRELGYFYLNQLETVLSTVVDLCTQNQIFSALCCFPCCIACIPCGMVGAPTITAGAPLGWSIKLRY